MKVTCTKKSQSRGKPAPAKLGTPIVAFNLEDDGSNTATVLGVDAAGNTLDISALATLTVTSDTPGTVAVALTTGMAFTMTAAGPLGTANITAVATWNDGSIGPFTITLPVTTVTGAVSGITIQPGTPTVV